MRKIQFMTFLSILLLTAGFAVAQGKENTGRKLTVSLTGAAEVPGPGDTDGTGTASVWLNQGQTQVCYEISVSNIDAATMAHIHEGAADVAGAVVITLMTPGADGMSKGCADASADLIKRIRQTPENFYVNVHNAAFPEGAVRGQLAKKKMKK